ncbi:MAG: enoyl-CoA hydratase/isomerase family protein [Myxococcota bacterium]
MGPTGDRVSTSFEAEGVALLTVSGPPPNPSTFACVDQLADQLERARDEGARVVVIASDVPGHWLGHASLADLTAMFRGQETSGSGAGFFRASDLLAKSELVSIAAISGDCGGGGCELGWACDLRVAEVQSRFSQMEILAGLIPGLGGIARLSKLIGRTAAAEIVLDGAAVPAPRLYELGALNRVVPTGGATEAALAWARRLAERPAAALALAKQVLSESEDLPLTESLANEQRQFQKIAATPEAMALMDEIQAQYDAGIVPPRVLVDPFET